MYFSNILLVKNIRLRVSVILIMQFCLFLMYLYFLLLFLSCTHPIYSA